MVRSFFQEIPAVYKQEFLHSIYRVNRHRAEKFALVIGLVNVVLILILDLPRYRNDAWEQNSYYFYAFLMHTAIVVLNSAYYVLSRIFKHLELDNGFSLAFVAITLLWCATFALLAQLIQGDTVVYSMGLFGISVSFYFTPVLRTLILLMIQTFVVVGLQFFEPADRLLVGIYINSFIGVILCWIISRFFLAIKLIDFLQLKEIQKKQAEIIQLNESLILANQEKNEFLGIAAHDLKNPLTGIMLNAEIVRDYADKMSSGEIASHMEKIEATSRRMRDIITNLLDINALDSGNFSLKKEYIDLHDFLKEIIEETEYTAKTKKITINPEFKDDDIFLKTDPQALHEVIDNLLSNALKFSPENSTVFVRLYHCDKSVRIEIEDQGPGFSIEDKAKIFHRFAKLSAKPTGSEISTGLGLSIVKKLVDILGGTIRLESEKGNGAKFIIVFPVTDEKELATHGKDIHH